ncbi:hypothetical protein BCR32DRAFT_266083 [Anaeromyces robustus]|uniref:Periplasmic binding protein-like II n=1 Tax=Anaeromyces robustus TaxID=1754192 RepID=A0A1Y1XGG8_9FUNG|nr:hypothetical protein BCR32DRAFT_266083 [Anaeromyces robustus]|eukprot:ORX84845.1 hypothetical protein BCR32DRAFT_266083 [Anaeromyces robustus]
MNSTITNNSSSIKNEKNEENKEINHISKSLHFSEEVDINIFAYSVEDGYNYKAYVDGFNQYSRKNNLDIKVELNLMTKIILHIPQTWDELIETSKEIIEKEKALNNTDLVGYNSFIIRSKNKNFSKEIELNVLAYTVDDGIAVKTYIDGFNQYAKDNNIDINAVLNIMTGKKFIESFDNHYFMIESLLKKKNNKYDIYFYDITYIKNYSPYLLDLKDLIPKEHLSMFDENILSQMCYYEDELPSTICLSTLYSNKVLLDKYNKRIPKTWDELIETSKEIIEKEKKLNNTGLVGYNGFMYDADFGLCSIYEFIYSCRESYNAPFPELTSETTVNALKLLKKVKTEV